MRRRLFHVLASLFGVAIFVTVLLVLRREFATMHPRDVVRALRALPWHRTLLAVLLTVVAYVVLTGYDFMGMRYLGRKLSHLRIMLASFLSYVFSNNVGLSRLGAGAVRYRIYTAWGFSAVEVLKLVLFAGLSFWLGILSLSGAVFVIAPPDFAGEPGASWFVRPLGVFETIMLFAL